MALLIVDMEGLMNDSVEENRKGREGRRRVSIGLGIGIALAPFIFAWFLLREGYSTLARGAGFGWLGFFALGYVSSLAMPDEGTKTDNGSGQAAVAATITLPSTEATTEQVMTATHASPSPSPRPGRPAGKPDCTLTSETDGWSLVKANAILTAERYAILHNPKAAFGDADGKPFFQSDGPYKGKYTLIISNDQVALAQLVPLFDFCTAANQLDPEGKLWKVVLAKLNGETF